MALKLKFQTSVNIAANFILNKKFKKKTFNFKDGDNIICPDCARAKMDQEEDQMLDNGQSIVNGHFDNYLLNNTVLK